MTFQTSTRIGLSGFAVLMAGILAACSSTSSGSQADVVSLSSGSPGASASPVASTVPVDGQEAFLDFTECMREQGIDMPDPQFGPNGDFQIGGPGPGGGDIDFEDPAFQAAQEACSDLLQGLAPDIDPEQQAELEENLLQFASCMRDNGVDMPDPQLGGPGGGGGALIGGADGDIDFGSPEVQAAMEECQPLLGDGPFGGAAPE